jgi:Arc/MetJ-type ribon-helix-helix transcriptional regulator
MFFDVLPNFDEIECGLGRQDIPRRHLRLAFQSNTFFVLRFVIRYTRGFMISPLTLRLEKKTRERIARIASRRRISTSEVIREAIEAWVERQEPIAAPYEAMADLIGVVNGGKPRRSVETGRGFKEVLKSRRKRP